MYTTYESWNFEYFLYENGPRDSLSFVFHLFIYFHFFFAGFSFLRFVQGSDGELFLHIAKVGDRAVLPCYHRSTGGSNSPQVNDENTGVILSQTFIIIATVFVTKIEFAVIQKLDMDPSKA